MVRSGVSNRSSRQARQEHIQRNCLGRARSPESVAGSAIYRPALAGWYLLDQIDSLLEVHAEVNERPFNALALVLLLLEDEHVVVEELLQFLVGEVDAQLLEAVELLDRVVQWSGRGG